MASSKSARASFITPSSCAKVFAECALPATVPGGAREQVRPHPLGQHLRRDPARVAVAPEEPRHPRRPNPRGELRGRVVGNEGEGDLAVHRGEQPRRCRVVGLQDRPQLGLGRLLGLEQPVTVARERPKLGEQR